MAQTNESILIVDDDALFRTTLSRALGDLGCTVHSVPDFEAAKTELFHGLRPFLVFADRKIGGCDVEKQHLSEIKRIWPEAHVIVYTRLEDLTVQQERFILSQGATRVLDRSHVADSVDKLLQEFQELRGVSSALGDLTGSRKNVVSLLVGADVGVTVIDKHYVCWFANKAQEEMVGRPCAGGLCWTLFHGHPPEAGPCWGCGIREVFKTERPTHRIILTYLPTGSISWQSVQCKPIHDREGRVIAALEAVSVYSEGLLRNMEATERLFLVARGMLHAGFGRVRVYSASSDTDQKELVAAVSRSDTIDGRQYYETLHGCDIRYNACPYSQKAVDVKMGLLVDSWEEFGDSPFKETLGLSPPYFTVPIWNDRGDKLVGFLEADFGDWPEDSRERAVRYLANDETLRWLREEYGKEVRKALIMRQSGVENVSPEVAYRQTLAERARLKIGAVASVEEAIDALQEAFAELVPGCVVTVRRKHGDRLVAEPRLCSPPAPVLPETEGVDDADSLAAYVLQTYRRPYWIDDYQAHRQAAPARGIPRGLSAQDIQSVAHLPVFFETTRYGTLSIDSRQRIRWKKDGYVEPLTKVAELVALVFREMAIHDDFQKRLQEAMAKTAALVAFASTTSRDAIWRHWAIQQLQALSARASVLVSVAGRLETEGLGANRAAVIDPIISVANAVDDAAAVLKRKHPVGDFFRTQSHPLRSLLDAVRARFEGKGVRFPEGCPDRRISVTRYHFCRMVEFLLDNALRECRNLQPPPGVEICVALSSEMLELDVVDHGPGISEELRGTILAGPVKSASGGEGIGLLIVRGTALQFSGDLTLISPAKPTRFRLTLPLAKDVNPGDKPWRDS